MSRPWLRPSTLASAILFGAMSVTTTSALAKSTVYNNVNSLATFEQKLEDYTEANDGKVLLVYDIDDTLMETVSFFGGDTWYNWQRGKAVKSESGEMITISSEDVMTCPFSKMGVFFDLGESHPVEKSTVSVVTELQRAHDTLVLTSRSPYYRSGTQRILDEAGFDFKQSSLLPTDFALFYQFDDGRSVRPLSYANGVVMSSGLNKGKVLQDILARTGRTYSAVFFLDDSRSNIDNMANAWESSETEVFIFHYTHADKTITQQDIAFSRNARTALNDFIGTAFPARFAEFNDGKCQ